MSRNVIRDGQTRRGYVAGVERGHDACRFKYRPMLPSIVEAVETAINTEKPRVVIATIASAVAEHLVEWSEVNEAGQPEPISNETTIRMVHSVLGKVYKVIAGLRASDIDPDDQRNDEDAQATARAILEQAAGGAPGFAELERREGN